MIPHLFFALLAFFISFAGCFTVIVLANHWGVGLDSPEGARRLHHRYIPRLGGVPMGLAFGIALLSVSFVDESLRRPGVYLLIALLPTFLAGVSEDLTGKVGIRMRLLATMVSAALAAWLLGAILTRVDLPITGSLLAHHIALAMVVTLIAGAGLPHAMNIIDGCNGLSCSAGLTALLGLFIIGWHVGDTFVAYSALMAIFTILGFLLWNFPLGRIFLGDGGAYTMGVLVAELSILLVVRHPDVSAWFPLLLVVHPVWEVLASCVRRARRGLRHMFQADAKHLHQLIYHRIVCRLLGCETPVRQALASSLTSLLFSILHVVALVLAVTFWSHTGVLMICAAGFALLYTLTYLVLTRFDLDKARHKLYHTAKPPTARAMATTNISATGVSHATSGSAQAATLINDLGNPLAAVAGSGTTFKAASNTTSRLRS